MLFVAVMQLKIMMATFFLTASKTGATEGESWALGLRLAALLTQTHGNVRSLSQLKCDWGNFLKSERTRMQQVVRRSDS